MDALLAMKQMPGGIPVAAMAIDKPGAVNAAIFAAEILALADEGIARKLVAHKEELARGVAEKNARLQKQLSEKKPPEFPTTNPSRLKHGEGGSQGSQERLRSSGAGTACRAPTGRQQEAAASMTQWLFLTALKLL